MVEEVFSSSRPQQCSNKFFHNLRSKLRVDRAFTPFSDGIALRGGRDRQIKNAHDEATSAEHFSIFARRLRKTLLAHSAKTAHDNTQKV